MDRQPPLTFDAVREAAEALQRQGQNVTIDALHALLGRGSKSTIHKHRARWRAEREAADTEAPATTTPEPLQVLFETTFSAFWQEALAHAEAALEHHRQAAEQLMADARTQVASASARVAEAEQRVAERQTEIASLRDALEARTEALVGERAQRAMVEAKAGAAAEHAAEDKARLEAEVVRAEAQLLEVKAEAGAALARFEAQRTEAEKRQAETERRAHEWLDAARREAAAREAELAQALRDQQQRVEATEAAWHAKESTWVQVRARLEGALDTERREVGRLTEALTHAQQQHAQAEEARRVLETACVVLEHTKSILEQQLREAEKYRQDLAQRVEALMRENAGWSARLEALAAGVAPDTSAQR